MASPEALAIKEQLRLLSETVGGAQSVEEQRAQYEIAASMMTVAPDGVAWTEVDAGGVPAIWADSEEGSSDHVVMYVHGGGEFQLELVGMRHRLHGFPRFDHDLVEQYRKAGLAVLVGGATRKDGVPFRVEMKSHDPG